MNDKNDAKQIKIIEKQGNKINKLIEQNKFNGITRLLISKNKSVKMATAKSLLDLILKGDYYQRIEIARLFKGVNDREILDLLLERAMTYDRMGCPEYTPLITAILHANGFNDLLGILKKQGEGSLAGHWSNKSLTTQLLGYAEAMGFGIDTYIKIIPYGSSLHSNITVLDTEAYIKKLPGIKITNEQMEEIKRLYEKRKEDLKEDSNDLFRAFNIMLEKLSI